jgi:ATP-dependent DNA helicase RecG
VIRKPVLSSHIRSIGYDPNEKRLEVEFHDGGVYSYHNVDEREHHSLMHAASIGKHFHTHIKHRHEHSKH